MRTTQQEQALERMFDCFCKTVVRNRNRDIIRQKKRLARREVPWEYLAEEPYAYDVYFADNAVFDVAGMLIPVGNELLAEALSALAPRRCQIVLLAYFMCFSDRQIAVELNLTRSTVQYQRNKALTQLRSMLESYHDREV